VVLWCFRKSPPDFRQGPFAGPSADDCRWLAKTKTWGKERLEHFAKRDLEGECSTNVGEVTKGQREGRIEQVDRRTGKSHDMASFISACCKGIYEDEPQL
jgi:hypothetical protein